MNGPQHYRKAEELIGEADKTESWEQEERLLRHAQIHATLAVAAATAMSHAKNMDEADMNAWDKAAGL